MGTASSSDPGIRSSLGVVLERMMPT